MVKHTQTIRQQIDDEFFEYVWPFCEIGSKWVNNLPCTSKLRLVCDASKSSPNLATHEYVPASSVLK